MKKVKNLLFLSLILTFLFFSASMPALADEGYDYNTPTEFPDEPPSLEVGAPSDIFDNPEKYDLDEIFNNLSDYETESLLEDYISLDRIDEDLDRAFEKNFPGVDLDALRQETSKDSVRRSILALTQRSGCPTEGLVPCGTEGCPCTLCDFFVMFDRIIDFALLKIVPVLAALMIAIGGFMYIIAFAGSGGPENISKAKTLFKSVVIGLILVYAAWLIVNVFFQLIGVNDWTGLKEGWWTIECESSAPAGDRGSTGSTSSSNSSGNSSGTPSSDTSGPVVLNNIEEEINGDELSVTLTFQNNTSETREYQVWLYDAKGNLIDREPDSHWFSDGFKNLDPGESYTTTVGSDWHNVDINDLREAGNTYTIKIFDQEGLTNVKEITRQLPN